MNKRLSLTEFLEEQGYHEITEINGSVCCLVPFTFTIGLITMVDRYGHFARFCYPKADYLDAVRAIREWDGQGDPPGPWIKQKGPLERHNPLLYEHKGGPWYEPLEKPKGDIWAPQTGMGFIWC